MTSVRNLRVQWSIYLLITIFLFSFPAFAKYSGGTGEPNDPYQIATTADLIALGENPGDYDKHFILTADIDLNPDLPGCKVFDKAVIAPDNSPSIFFQGGRFTGLFDGNGHVISHLTVTGEDYLGLFGELASDAKIKNLGVVDIDITGNNSIGGLVGYNMASDITRCYSTGRVSGNSDVGGLAGYTQGGSITCSYSTTEVSGSLYVGGLVGEQWGTITNCYSSGAVSCTWISVGGISGGNWGTIANCYSTSIVSGTESVGGLSGAMTLRGLVTDSFWDIKTSGLAESFGGTGKTTAEMQMAATFTNWDFETTWMIQEGVDYPRLQWEVYGIPSPVPTTIEKLSGDNRSGRVGFKLVFPLTVLVKDQDDTLMPNIQVEFIVTEGGGTIEPVSAMTDNSGIASTELTLGPTPGLNQVEAIVGSLSVIFNVTGLAPEYGGGTGEPNDPYQILTAEQMNVIGAVPNDWDKHFKLMSDIDMSIFDGKEGRSAFNIIGTSSGNAFTGSFDGDGHVISHLTIVGDDDIGLFGYLRYGAEVRDLGIVDVNIVSLGWSVGGLVGQNQGSVARCFCTGRIRGGYGLGALVGENHGNLTHSYGSALVSGSYAGGLVGRNFGDVMYCFSTGKVNGSSVGGLVGDCPLMFATVLHCVWDIETSGLSDSAGGIGLTTSQMMDSDMLGLNGFANDPNWVLDAGLDYPRLAWEETPGQIISEPNIDWLDGDGTAEAPYVIDTTDQLIMLSRASALWDTHLVLGADIDMDSNLPNTPVFTQSPIQVFMGIFDGRNHTISHLTITGVSHVGLFGQLEFGGEVRNLGVVDINVSGYRYVGGLVGMSYGGIANCYSTGVVTASGQGTGGFYVGGLVGYNTSPVTCCYSASTVSGTQWSIGGLLGYSHGPIQQCYSTGAVKGSHRVGGLIGENAGLVTQCYSTGEVGRASYAGGLVGYNYFWSEITDCFWDIQTSGQSSSAGGTGKTTTEMKTAATFTSWDLENIWTINEGVDYPKFQWAASSEPIYPPVQEKYGGGTGTANNPYQIWTAEQMNAIGADPQDWDKHFKLMEDIDLRAYTGTTFNIIGVNANYGQPFSGVFDGNGKTISNFILMGSSASSQGLFGAVEGQGALIENLRLTGTNINAGTMGMVSALVGYLHSGTISGCHVKGGSISGGSSVGGLVGICNGTVVNW